MTNKTETKLPSSKYKIVKAPGKVMNDIPVPYHDAEGELVGQVVVEAAPLGGRIRRRLMFDAVVRHEANQRHGCHKVKTRSEVAGTSKKMYRQKGTGNARAGTKQAPQRRGGGVVHGPVVRSHRQDINKKARRLAKLCALLSKFADQEAAVISSLDFSAPRTARLVSLLEATGTTDEARSCLVLIGKDEGVGNLLLSSRNLKRVGVAPLMQANTYDVLFHRRLLMTKKALDELMGHEVPVVAGPAPGRSGVAGPAPGRSGVAGGAIQANASEAKS